MTFEAPIRLWGLAIPAALAIWYLARRFRREQPAVPLSTVGAARAAGRRGGGWRRHVIALASTLAMAALVVAFSGPRMALPVPVDQATVVLAIDVSLSMAADDIEPSRIEAAKDAARDFLELAPESLRVGLVAFAGTSLPVTPPTDDRALVSEAVSRLGLGQGTAVGEAIFTSLAEVARAGVPDGSSAAIVVLSDGETTLGRPDAEAAAAAAQAGIPVYTIAFGTQRGVIDVQGELVPVPVNQGALADVAAATDGEFFEAASEAELRRVFDAVESQIAFEVEERDVTEWFIALGLVGMALAGAASIRWFDRV